MRTQAFLLILAAIALSACTTPQTTLRNKAGHTVTCGGGVSGSLLGGMIGHNVEKDNDRKCVQDYEAKGYQKIETRE